MRTLGARPVDTNRPDGPHDIDGTVIDGIDSLRQRIAQRILFRRGTWQLDRRLGTDTILGHQVALPLVKAILVDAIVDEGGRELDGAPSIEAFLDHDTRVLRFIAVVPTIYGRMVLTGTAP